MRPTIILEHFRMGINQIGKTEKKIALPLGWTQPKAHQKKRPHKSTCPLAS
jgi:hypothetical protein